MAEGQGSRQATHNEGQNVAEMGQEASFAPSLAQPAENAPVQPRAPVQDQGNLLQALEMILNRPPQVSIAKELKDLKVSDFVDGDPVAADLWLNDLKIVLVGLHCNDQRKLEGAVSLLKGHARIWWSNVITCPREEITWDFFLREFSNKYVGDMFVRQMRNEFINLKQGNWTVYEYESEFNKLSRFASELIPTEKDRTIAFIEGLDIDYKEMLIAMNITEFQEAVNWAKGMERVRIERTAS